MTNQCVGGESQTDGTRGARALVCGGRDFVMTDHYASVFHRTVGAAGVTTIIHGGAKGADREAGKLAKGRGLHVEEFPANWQRDGKAAGPIRNRRMLEEGKPDFVIAFPGGKGTAHMVKIAQQAGVPVYEISGARPLPLVRLAGEVGNV